MSKHIKLFKTRNNYDSHTANIIENERPEVCCCRDGRLVSYYPTIVKIICADNITTETFQCSLNSKGVKINNGIVWSIVEGMNYATINSSGLMTILSGANNSRVVLSVKWGVSSITKECFVSYESGIETSIDVNVIENTDGTTTEVTSTTIEREDGTSSISTMSIIYDENGDTDGSYTNITMNYDENGEPTEKVNETGDSNGNVNTQEITIDTSGNEIVTGYTIDTSQNESGNGEIINNDGVNTQYYPFDPVNGFELYIDFRCNHTNQPPNQNENHHNILTAKRVDPSPWYGFHIRTTGGKQITLGIQYSTGSNTNINIPVSTNDYRYKIRITYNPTNTSGYKFVAENINTINGSITYLEQSNKVFPDIPELHDLKIVLGAALNTNGTLYRFANINVYEFNVRKL